jgi:hypothetical protein
MQKGHSEAMRSRLLRSSQRGGKHAEIDAASRSCFPRVPPGLSSSGATLICFFGAVVRRRASGTSLYDQQRFVLWLGLGHQVNVVRNAARPAGAHGDKDAVVDPGELRVSGLDRH